jgi:hypothetical protein
VQPLVDWSNLHRFNTLLVNIVIKVCSSSYPAPQASFIVYCEAYTVKAMGDIASSSSEDRHYNEAVRGKQLTRMVT